MSAAAPHQLVDRFLRSLRAQFFCGQDKLYYQERGLLMRAITYPAAWLDQRGVRTLPPARYTEILTKIIRTINAHGDLGVIRSPGRYLLHAVQEHMRHHGDDYYEEAKALRNAVADALLGIRRANADAARESASASPVGALAEAYKVLSASKGARARSASTTGSQWRLPL